MPGNSSNRPMYTVACSCGARMTLDARSFGRPRPCRCGNSVTVAWGRDPRTRKTVPVAMTQAPARKAAMKSPYTAFCGCGYTRPVPLDQAHTTPPCPGCGKLMIVEKAPDPKELQKIHKSEKLKPSAPLAPLHLRPPLKVRLNPGAQFFECPCGERILLRSGAAGRPIQCPACDRFHIVEVINTPPPGPPPSGAAPRGAPKPPPRELRLGEFLCACGAIQPPRTSRTGKDFACSACGRKGHVEASLDPKTQRPVMKPVFTSQPTVAPPVRPAEPAAEGWTCKCGFTLEPHLVLAQRELPCPGCGRIVKTEKARLPHSTLTRIRPVFTEAPREPEPPPPPPTPPPSKPAAPLAIFDLVPQPVEDESSDVIAADAQIALCECGAELLVSRDDVGQPIQCPACEARMTVEEVPDSSTGVPSLRVRSIARTDDDAWSMDDFK